MKEKLKGVNRKMTNDGEEKSGKMKKTQDAVQSSSYQNMWNIPHLYSSYFKLHVLRRFVLQLELFRVYDNIYLSFLLTGTTWVKACNFRIISIVTVIQTVIIYEIILFTRGIAHVS
ncbi:hypothetical protein D7Z29_20265 [Escherichia fergusonii]|nr:hypothetical protein D7Z29_20265 [Escherichia fergusonii]